MKRSGFFSRRRRPCQCWLFGFAVLVAASLFWQASAVADKVYLPGTEIYLHLFNGDESVTAASFTSIRLDGSHYRVDDGSLGIYSGHAEAINTGVLIAEGSYSGTNTIRCMDIHARLKYWFTISKPAEAPLVPVPVDIETSYTIRHTGAADAAILLYFYRGREDLGWDEWLFKDAYRDGDQSMNLTFHKNLIPTVAYGFEMDAIGDAGCEYKDGEWIYGGDFYAYLDPVIKIDPSFMVDGVPANEIYSIVLSDGMLNGAPAPLPSSLLLLGSGLVGVLGWGRRFMKA